MCFAAFYVHSGRLSTIVKQCAQINWNIYNKLVPSFIVNNVVKANNQLFELVMLWKLLHLSITLVHRAMFHSLMFLHWLHFIQLHFVFMCKYNARCMECDIAFISLYNSLIARIAAGQFCNVMFY